MMAKNHTVFGLLREAPRSPARNAMPWAVQPEALVFWGLVAVYLLPVWIFPFFPSQDGPAHLSNANALREYYSPEAPVFREYYTINAYPNPNWFGHIVLAALMYLVSMLTAEKLLLSGYVVLLPLSVRYMTGAGAFSSSVGAFLVFPFIYNYTLQMGFYNFCYSMVMYFFCVGYWLRNQERFRAHSTVVLALLSLLLYFCHPLSLVMAYITVAVLLVFGSFYESYEERANILAAWRTFRSRLAFPALALLPSLGLMLWFLGHHGAGVDWEHFVLDPRVLFWDLVSYQWAELRAFKVLGLGLGVVAVALIVSRVITGRVLRWDGFLVVLAVFILVFILAPEHIAGGGYVHPRLVLYIWFALNIMASGARLVDAYGVDA